MLEVVATVLLGGVMRDRTTVAFGMTAPDMSPIVPEIFDVLAAELLPEKSMTAIAVQEIAAIFIIAVTFPRFIAGFKIARIRVSSWDRVAIATDEESASAWDRTPDAISTRCRA